MTCYCETECSTVSAVIIRARYLLLYPVELTIPGHAGKPRTLASTTSLTWLYIVHGARGPYIGGGVVCVSWLLALYGILCTWRTYNLCEVRLS